VAINDRNILISDHVIDNINCTNGKINWGIGIGLAGSTYDNDYPEKQTVKNFVVANITGSNCRQLVHVENGKHFIIRNIKAKNITPDFSKKAGIDNATVAIYGCDNFIIDNVDMVNSAGMLIGYGVIKGDYLSIPQNFKLNDIRLDNRQLAISCAEYRFHPVMPPRLWPLPTLTCSAPRWNCTTSRSIFSYAISM
jgi:colanic acid biosynthesis protein WcaM